MKINSDNYRESSIISIIENLKIIGARIIIYDENLISETIFGCEIINNLETFKKLSEIIVTNRYSSILDYVYEKVYTRDLFNRD